MTVVPHGPKNSLEVNAHFIFVHGTFSSIRYWPTKSLLADLISFHYGLDSISRFKWSGANSNKARQKAAFRLSKQVKRIKQSKPNTLIFVVAHSHGGNVVCYALKDMDTNAAVAGVITLGTPFLGVKKRRTRPIIQRIGTWFPFRVTFLCMLWFLCWLLVWGRIWDDPPPYWLAIPNSLWSVARYGSLALWILPFLVILLMGVFQDSIKSLFYRTAKGITKQKHRTFEQMSFPKSCDTPLLYVCDPFDEALWLLRIQNLFTLVPIGLYRSISIGPWIALGSIIFALINDIASFSTPSEMDATITFSMSIGVFTLSVIAVAIVELALVLWIWVVQGNSLAYGRDPIGTYLWCHVYADIEPPSSMVNVVPCYYKVPPVKMIALRHFAFYDANQVARMVLRYASDICNGVLEDET